LSYERFVNARAKGTCRKDANVNQGETMHKTENEIKAGIVKNVFIHDIVENLFVSFIFDRNDCEPVSKET